MKKKLSLVLLGAVCLVLLLIASREITGKVMNHGTDYSDASLWAYRPEVHEKDVDVFFIAPTSVGGDAYNMDMTDEKSRYNFTGATNMEKGIYDDKADFYAPYYRQMTLAGYDLPAEENEKYLAIAYEDVRASFEYYMKHYNEGRGVILAGFSQGADMVERLLMDYDLKDQLIAAYIIGWNVTDEELEKYPSLKMAEGEFDTGVIVSFCSESEDMTTSIIVPDTTNGINPLNWKTDDTCADKSENLGACFTDYDGNIKEEIPGLCGAYLDAERGTLKVLDVTPQDYPGGLSFLEDGNYHLYDYQFFYRNLEQNVQDRIDSYRREHEK